MNRGTCTGQERPVAAREPQVGGGWAGAWGCSHDPCPTLPPVLAVLALPPTCTACTGPRRDIQGPPAPAVVCENGSAQSMLRGGPSTPF